MSVFLIMMTQFYAVPGDCTFNLLQIIFCEPEGVWVKLVITWLQCWYDVVTILIQACLIYFLLSYQLEVHVFLCISIKFISILAHAKIKDFRPIIGKKVGEKSQFDLSIICPYLIIHYAYKKKNMYLTVQLIRILIFRWHLLKSFGQITVYIYIFSKSLF